jgi:transposase-like protein
MKSNQAYASIPTVLPAEERSEAERSEAERSGAAGKTVADSGAVPRPDPQVVAKAKRRIFTAEYKQRILAEADKAKERLGALGTLLRRESLYSSHLVSWRKERAAGILHALTPQKRGPKSKRNPFDEENQKLCRENQHLTEELRKAEIVIEVQKKVAMLLGRPILAPDREEKP